MFYRWSWRSDRDPNGPRPFVGSVERSLDREIERDPRQARGAAQYLMPASSEAALRKMTRTTRWADQRLPRCKIGDLRPKAGRPAAVGCSISSFRGRVLTASRGLSAVQAANSGMSFVKVVNRAIYDVVEHPKRDYPVAG